MPANPERHADRRQALREILLAEEIRSQGDLLERLEVRGFRVTQSSVSRDLQELGVAKVGGRYVLTEALAEALGGSGTGAPGKGRGRARGPAASGGAPPAGAPAETALAEAAAQLTSMVPAGPNLLVLRTGPGRAQLVSVALDAAGWPDIVGTVAGDDTLFVATTGRAPQARVQARLERLQRR